MGNNALFSIFYPIFLAHVIHGSTLNTHKQMCKLTFLMLLKGNPYQRHSLTKPFSFVFKYFYFFHSLVGELFFFSFFFFCPLSGPKKRNFSVANEPTEKCIRWRIRCSIIGEIKSNGWKWFSIPHTCLTPFIAAHIETKLLNFMETLIRLTMWKWNRLFVWSGSRIVSVIISWRRKTKDR